MKKKQTQRGFDLFNFKDRNGCKCSLQASSIATESCIWLGTDDADPKVLIPGKGWTKVKVPKDTLFNTRMHLNQKQVQRLLPHLQKFAETGEL